MTAVMARRLCRRGNLFLTMNRTSYIIQLNRIISIIQLGGVRMVSFAELVLGAGAPIYLQIVVYVKRGMVAGTIQNGDEMPSRRVLSSLLGVNPNTVQKAYRMLEEEGLISSHAGAKSYASCTPDTVQSLRRQLLEADVQTLIEAMRQMDVTKSEAIALLETLW